MLFVPLWFLESKINHRGTGSTELEPREGEKLRSLIVCNGVAPSTQLLTRLCAESQYRIAADGGIFAFDAAQLSPDLVIGDLDSFDRGARKKDETLKVLRVLDQNFTDLDKALAHARTEGASTIVVSGVLGGLVTHEISNFNSLQKFSSEVEIEIEEDSLYGVFLTSPGPRTQWSAELPLGSTVSLFSFSGAKGVSTSGLRWTLENHDLQFGRGVSIHNVIDKSPCEIKIKSGVLLVCVERNKEGAAPKLPA